MIKRLQHCSLVVRDVDDSKAFYCDFLGMQEVPRPENFKFAGAWFRVNSTEIHIIASKDTSAPPGLPDQGTGKHTGLATHFAFEVINIETMKARADEMGVPVVGGPMPRGDGVYQLYLQDPDGYLIELFQWMENKGDSLLRSPVSE